MLCDCEKEEERRERKEEEKEKKRLRNLLMSDQGGPARDGSGMWEERNGSGHNMDSCCDDAENCSFFSCGVGSGGGSWLPLAGSALLLALLAYLIKYISKAVLGKRSVKGSQVGRTQGFESKKRDKDTPAVTKNESKKIPSYRIKLECPVIK